VKEIVIGMPHRGRLNVLTQVMGKPHRALFHEFKGGSANPDAVEGSGDVKYHLGASSDREFDNNRIHLSLTANPSHLEIVDPVVLGKVRAKQDQRGDPPDQRISVLPLLMHGDAAFAGQGVVAECFGLSDLKGYRTGGSLHFIVNNQIGFTTYPRYSRSSPYPSDVAKMIDAPIFHVNGDDPEAVVFAAKVAIEFRQKFHKPVVIDMFCYRRHGHNEGDEPMFTQPVMYKKIASHPGTVEIYSKRLIADGVMTEGEVEKAKADWRARLDAELDAGSGFKPNKADWLDGKWAGFKSADAEEDPRRGVTGVDIAVLKEIGRKITKVPDGFRIHRTVQRFLENRAKAIDTGVGIDWATGEGLAFCTLLQEGHHVRLSGQDSERGTFSQRHSVLIDQTNENRYIPLSHVREGQAAFEVVDSPLSEAAVLGFEYGYSLADPHALVLWEAQFGDFANGAQVIIDQFIASGEAKWLRMSGVVLLLPHGHEGQGPEHSSARLERYLTLCGEDNWQVCNLTSAANYFHLLRRQVRRNFRKPLILMAPKSMLRAPEMMSKLTDMGPGTSFHRVFGDDTALVNPAKARRVVLTTGKVHFDLAKYRTENKINDVALIRIEQLYPFPFNTLAKELGPYKNAEFVWCQEEPENAGAWHFIDRKIEKVLASIDVKGKRARYVGRPEAAATATGLLRRHNAQQAQLVAEAFAK
jgi:2-oxoglutarate dehydrogenase E1 component